MTEGTVPYFAFQYIFIHLKNIEKPILCRKVETRRVSKILPTFARNEFCNGNLFREY